MDELELETENVTTILSSVKSALAIEESIDDYDHDLIVYINAAIFRLNSLLPTEFALVSVDGDTVLDSIFNDEAVIPKRINSVYNTILTLIILEVRNFFNPHKSSSIQKVYDETIKEYQYSLMATIESALWEVYDE